MTKRNSNKQFHTIKQTILICGEGKREENFLRFLRRLFSCSNNLSVKIVNANGGSAPGIVKYATRCIGDYSKIAVVLDSDKSIIEMDKARKIASDNNILLIENDPCLEALFLQILDTNIYNMSSKECKNKFASQYDKETVDDLTILGNIFPVELLVNKRKVINNFDKIIRLFENQIEY